jgi:hypothetical protein
MVMKDKQDGAGDLPHDIEGYLLVDWLKYFGILVSERKTKQIKQSSSSLLQIVMCFLVQSGVCLFDL